MAVETMEHVDVPVARTRLRVEFLLLDQTTCTRRALGVVRDVLEATGVEESCGCR
jgi:hypothetical protein